MAMTREQGIGLVAPARPAKGASSGRLTLEDFILDEKGLVRRCTNNIEPASTSIAKAKPRARFDFSIRQKCPHTQLCPVHVAKRDSHFAHFQYMPSRAANQKRRLYEQSDAFRDIYRWRAGIEASMSRLKYQMNLSPSTHSWHARHAPRRQSARPRFQYPVMQRHRAIKNICLGLQSATDFLPARQFLTIALPGRLTAHSSMLGQGLWR